MDIIYTEPGKNLEPEEGYEYLSIPNTGGAIKVRPVVISVTSAPYSEEGEHVIRVTAAVMNNEGTVSTSQRRDFSFVVKINENTEEFITEVKTEDINMVSDIFVEEPATNKSNENKIINNIEEDEGDKTEITNKTVKNQPESESALNPTGMVISGSSMLAVFIWVVVIIVIIIIRRSK